jgi:hypothetical protein
VAFLVLSTNARRLGKSATVAAAWSFCLFSAEAIVPVAPFLLSGQPGLVGPFGGR